MFEARPKRDHFRMRCLRRIGEDLEKISCGTGSRSDAAPGVIGIAPHLATL